MLKSSMNPMALPNTRSTSACLRCSGVTADPSAISSDMRIISLPYAPRRSDCAYCSERCEDGLLPITALLDTSVNRGLEVGLGLLRPPHLPARASRQGV